VKTKVVLLLGARPQKMNYAFILAIFSTSFLPFILYPYLPKILYSYLPTTPGRKKMVSFVNFRPAIGISPEKGKKLNMWALNLNHMWKPYTSYSPDFTDLAIKAVVDY